MIKRRPRRHDLIEVVSNPKEARKGIFIKFKPLGIVTKVKGNVAHIRTETGDTCFLYETLSNGFSLYHRIGE